MLHVQEISKSYHGEVAVNGISFQLKRGVIYGILGPNGAGKTTLLSMIAGLLKPDQGSIQLGNLNSHSPEYKKKVGFVSDAVSIYDYLTGREYIKFTASLRDVPKKIQDIEIERLARVFRMEHKLDQFIKTYSKGMRQKTALISSLVHQPELLILDEPFSGLDPNALKEMKDYLTDYITKGNSIIFSTHILEIAEKLCKELMIIHSGKKMAEGNIDQLKNDLQLDHSTDLESIFYQMTSG
ncbi:ABC transporter ATP-binding protein [Siminovitchia sediminis]|uniref:ABC transporter ATP-binding protein n=1 Tax=Siminovitchia sediminis TaxID=1274353 RepID=A0ABW4KHU8_9BACI